MNSFIRLGFLAFLVGPANMVVAQSYPTAAPGQAGAAERPNVLFIISDDLNAGIGCYGDPLVKTPNIDRLAARGVRFERAYCQYPLCGPSRNSMLTGLHPNSTGIIENAEIFRSSIPDAVSLPQAFRLDGYFAAKVGKLYHYNVPKSVGTAGHGDATSWELQINPAGCDRVIEEDETFSLRPGSFGGTLSWYASPRADQLHTDGMIARDASWLLQRTADRRDRPFFLAVGFYRPHTPYTAPATYFQSYRLDQMPVVKDWKKDQEDVPASALIARQKAQDEMSDDLRRQARQAYYASITFMDAQVGVVLDQLEATGQIDNTIIVFTSDHGYHLGEHGLWQKLSLFEGSARVPLIIAAPGVRGGQVCRSPVGLVDLYPTLTELAGVPAPQAIQGQSLVPMLNDPTTLGRGYALTQLLRYRTQGKSGKKVAVADGFSIRTPRFRYSLWKGDAGGEELYDHDEDPGELTNLAGDPNFATDVERLRSMLSSAVKDTFPDDGKRPPVLRRPWSPNLTYRVQDQMEKP